MKAFFIGVIAIMLLAQTVGLGRVFSLLATHQDEISELLPPLRSPLYRPSERETATAQLIYATCTDAANNARNESVSPMLAEYGGYLVCYIGNMTTRPRQLCDADTRNRLFRYTRGYFGMIANLKRDNDDPAQREFIKMQRKMDRRSDIETGKDEFSPDPAIIEGWKILVSEGAFAKEGDFASRLEPEVPASFIDTLTAVNPGKAICP